MLISPFLSTTNLSTLSEQVQANTTNVARKLDRSEFTEAINQINQNLGIQPKQLQTQDIPLNGETNLNNYKTPGIYISKDASTTSGLSNKPSGAYNSAFTLIVIPHMEKSVRQILLTGESNDNGNRIYMRNYQKSSNSWGKSENNGWYELYGDHNLKPLQMTVEWSDSSEPSTTYTLLQK